MCSFASPLVPAGPHPSLPAQARYRVLFSTLLAGAKGIDEGLVNPDKAWCGTRRFGMAFYDQQTQVRGAWVVGGCLCCL